MKEDFFKDLAENLRCPGQEMGVKLGVNMNETNIGMTSETIYALKLAKSDVVLELGHGNCGHLSEILHQADDITYFGLEISPMMQQQAELINQKQMINNKVHFQLYDGINIPFEQETFDKAMTVNTVYFWEKPEQFLQEIYRILKPNGVFALCFAQKIFMQEKLPFAKYGFELYDDDDMQKLISKTAFHLVDIINKTEQITSKTGELQNRDYSIAVMRK